MKAKKCGFAFAEQVIDDVPITEHDVPVEMLVTDEEVLYFGKGKPAGSAGSPQAEVKTKKTPTSKQGPSKG